MSSDFACANGVEDWIERFCYWQGKTGQRYLFTKIEIEDLPHFSNCVLLITRTCASGSPQLQWIGNIDDEPHNLLHRLTAKYQGHIKAYIHLLAGNSDKRQEVVQDLSDQPGKQETALSA